MIFSAPGPRLEATYEMGSNVRGLLLGKDRRPNQVTLDYTDLRILLSKPTESVLEHLSMIYQTLSEK